MQIKPTTRVYSSLAGHAFCIDLELEVAHLANAFARQEAAESQASSLQMSLEVDRRQVDSALQGIASGSIHQRYGDAHMWLASQSRHVQRLAPVSSGGIDTAVATVTFDQAEGLDGSLRARPGNEVISAWAASRGIIPIHASGIAIGGRALLLLGEGGSGKTTTALALAERGWDLLADDLCFIYRDGPQTKVASLYATAIVTQNSLPRLQAGQWEDLGKTHHGKSARRLPPSINLVSEAELAGVVWVSATMGELYKPVALSRRQALVPWQAAFAPALQAHGPSANWVHQLAGLSRSAPAWHMRLGWDLDQIETTLRDLISRTSLCDVPHE
jgi:hypothetical protein